MIPILERELAQKLKWCTSDELTDYYVISQCSPGIISVNVASFVGFKLKRKWGAVTATLGVIFPSIIIITVIAAFIDSFSEYEIVQNALGGIRVAVCALVAVAVWKLLRKGVKDVLGAVIFSVALILIILFNIAPPYIVAGAAVIGIVVNTLRRAKTAGGQKSE